MPVLYNIDWTRSMNQTFEFYKVDPYTWEDVEKIDFVESCTIDRDLEAETLGSVSIDCSDFIDECYVRFYMIVTQNKITERVCLGTYLVQTPSFSFDGKKKSLSMTGYTPLIELKNDQPPLGYSILKNADILTNAYNICIEHCRAPITKPSVSKSLLDNFISNTDDTWFSFTNDLIANAGYSFGLSENGDILFEPSTEMSALSPVWIFNDDNSSILLPEVSDENDLYDVPNVVEVIYSNVAGYFYSKVVNDDPNSPISTVNRGRVVLYRDTDPNISGTATQAYVDEYAKALLKSLSCLQHTVTYTHAYCPVRLGDCVMLNYESAGIIDTKAKVIAQSIKCETGCTVQETAVYATSLWG